MAMWIDATRRTSLTVAKTTIPEIKLSYGPL